MAVNTVTVDFTAEAGTQTSATIERGTSATGPWTFLTSVTLVGEQAVINDNTAPLDTAVWYRATAQDGTVEVYGPFTLASGGSVFLRDPLRPWADLEFTFCATQAGLKKEMCLPSGPEFVWMGFGQEVYRADAGLFDRLDAETPADVYARRKRLDGSISFMTKTLAAAERVYELFTAGGPLFLQLPSVYGWQDAYIQPGDLTRDYLYPDQRMPHRIWSVPFTVVDATTGPTQGTECANWCAVAETFPTFADMVGSGGTWLDVAQGELVCPAGELVEALADTFSRVVVDGWGSADTGQAWTIEQGAATQFDVTGTAGTHTHTATNQTLLSTVPFSSADVNASANMSLSVQPAGDSAFLFLTARTQDAMNFYAGRLLIVAGGGMSVALVKRIGGVNTTLTSASLGLTYTANTVYRMRFAVQGGVLSAKVWLASGPEPAAYQVSIADGDLTSFGDVGVRTLLNAAVSNPLPITFSFDNLVVVP